MNLYADIYCDLLHQVLDSELLAGKFFNLKQSNFFHNTLTALKNAPHAVRLFFSLYASQFKIYINGKIRQNCRKIFACRVTNPIYMDRRRIAKY